MGKLIFGFLILAIALAYTTTYGFLPTSVQGKKLIRVLAIISAFIILVISVNQALQDYKNYKFADISAKDGKVIGSKSFPWKITKTITHEGNTVFVINERYGDASAISIKSKKPMDEFIIYNAIDGVAIKFLCLDDEIADFRIIISE
jgi:hypothetical protein